MGIVLAAYDPELDRKVALKLLKPSREDTTSARQRLQREAQALAKLNHPNVVGVHDVGVHERRVFVAMEFVEGKTLTAWSRETPKRSWRAIVEVFEAAGQGLAAAHDVALVHRDFKPDNVMLGDDGRVRVMDFGLARADLETDAPVDLCSPSRSSPLHTRLTQTGAVLGTPAYMAPEQVAGLELSDKSDQFSFCVAFFEALYGTRPFQGDSVAALVAAVADGRIVDAPGAPAVPSWLRRLVVRGLSSEPDKRHASMHALLSDLAAGEVRRRRYLVAAVGGAAVAGACGLLGAHRWDEHGRVEGCRDEGDAIDAVWNPPRRVAVRSAMMATGVAHAESTATKVLPWLDRQADAWRGAATDACLAVHVRGDWDQASFERAQWCLEERRLQLTSLVDTLLGSRPATLNAAVRAAASLQPVDPCLDKALLDRLPAPPHERRTEVDAVRAELSKAAALEATADFDAALAVARSARARAEEIAWEPLVASAMLREGSLLQAIGAPEDAESVLEAAYFKAAKAGALEETLTISQTLIGVVGSDLERHAEGLRWWEHAEVARSRLPDAEGTRKVAGLTAASMVLESMKDLDAARTLAREAVAIEASALGASRLSLATSLNNLALIETADGNWDTARALHERSLVIREEVLGAWHPKVATSLANLAGALFEAGELDRPFELWQRALAIRERTLGPEHPMVAADQLAIASVHIRRGQFHEALALHELAIPKLEKVRGAHPDFATALNAHAWLLQQTGDQEGAYAALERSLAIRERVFGPDHPSIATILHNLGWIRHSQGDLKEALPLFERALEIRIAALGADHPQVAVVHLALGKVALEGDRLAEASAHAEAALRIRQQRSVPSSDLAQARFLLAKVLRARRVRGSRARELAELARAEFEGVERFSEDLAEVERWLDDTG